MSNSQPDVGRSLDAFFLGALIRKHPLPAIGVALGIGWLLGAYTRRS